MKDTKVYSCFPGTGKTHFFKNSPLEVLDSDSSKFDKSDFPLNYVEHIKENIGKVDIMLVSSHKEVRQAMQILDIPYELVYPHKLLKAEYKNRYVERGSPNGFLVTMGLLWDDFIKTCWEDEGAANHYVLRSGQYLSDIINK